MGQIIIITGPMYAGKTEELLKRIKRFTYAKKKCILLKHSFYTRYNNNAIVTHNKVKEKCIVVGNSNDIKNETGLDMDYMGIPFGPMGSILAIADEIVKLKAICSICGNDAMFSKRIIEKKGTILVGAAESYTPVCREHFNKKISNSFYSHKKE